MLSTLFLAIAIAGNASGFNLTQFTPRAHQVKALTKENNYGAEKAFWESGASPGWAMGGGCVTADAKDIPCLSDIATCTLYKGIPGCLQCPQSSSKVTKRYRRESTPSWIVRFEDADRAIEDRDSYMTYGLVSTDDHVAQCKELCKKNADKSCVAINVFKDNYAKGEGADPADYTCALYDKPLDLTKLSNRGHQDEGDGGITRITDSAGYELRA